MSQKYYTRHRRLQRRSEALGRMVVAIPPLARVQLGHSVVVSSRAVEWEYGFLDPPYVLHDKLLYNSFALTRYVGSFGAAIQSNTYTCPLLDWEIRRLPNWNHQPHDPP